MRRGGEWLDEGRLGELEDEEHLPLIFLETVDRRDAGVVERSEDLGLAPKPGKPFRIAADVFGQDLERDFSADRYLLSLVDDPHAPAAQLADDAEAPLRIRPGMGSIGFPTGRLEEPGFRYLCPGQRPALLIQNDACGQTSVFTPLGQDR